MPIVSGGGGGGGSSSQFTFFRKTTAKAVNNTTTATDLLNGEITIPAGTIGATGRLWFEASGDFLQNVGSAEPTMRFQFLLGGTTIFDTNVGPNIGTGATRGGWHIICIVQNTATNAQVSYISHDIEAPGSFAAGQANFVTGTGMGIVTGTAAPGLLVGNGHNTTAIDTTASCALVLNVINGFANASYETKLFAAYVQIG